MNNSLPPGFQLEDDPVPQGQTGPGPTSPVSSLPPGFELEEEKYGSLPQQTIAGMEAIASGATLGGSRVAENELGLTTPEAQKRRSEQNPVTSTLGEIVGTGGLLLGTGGLGPIVEGAGIAAKIGAMAIEGGVLGGGSAVSDYAMGDPNLNAQKVLSYIGTGAVIGGGLGALFEGAGPVIAAGRERAASLGKAVKSVYGGADKEAATAATDALEAGDKIVAPPQKGVQPTSLEEMQKKVADAKYSGTAIEKPAKAELEDAVSRVEMSNPVQPMQLDALGSQGSQDIYNTARETGGDVGKTIQQYEAIQKAELVAKTDNAIQSVAGTEPITSDAVKGGNVASDYFTNAYQAEKKSAGELVGAAKQIKTPGIDHLNGVLDSMSDAVPQLGKMVTRTADGVKIEPYYTGMGISKQTYRAVKDAITSLEKDPENFGNLFSIRDGIENGFNPLTADKLAKNEIPRLRSSMTNYMQDASGNPEIRNALKRYAINEENGQIIKKSFGADLNDSYETALSKIKPEMIGDKIFSNTANVNAAKQILPREQFNHILGNWLAEARTAATDKGAFSSNKFGSFLRKNQDALGAAFSDNPQGLQRLKDINTITRILPDAPSGNPSGTAKTLIHYLNGAHGAMDIGVALGKFLKDKTIGSLKAEVAAQQVNQRLAGRAADFTIKDAIQKAIQKTTDKIDMGAKSIFKSNSSDVIKGALIPSAVDHYEKNVKKIQRLNNDQSSLMDHLTSLSDTLYASAPHISNGINAAVINSVQFLNSKLPKPNSELPFSAKWMPTQSQKVKFNRYFEAVNDPLIALKQVKNGSLNNETMEALMAVHPDLLQDMRQQIMSNIDPDKKDLNYATQIALSKFLGQPMNNSMLPQVIASNQVSFMSQSPSQLMQGGSRKKGSTLGGLKELNRAKLAQTETQVLEEEPV